MDINAEKLIANIKIKGTYHSEGASAGIRLDTELAKLPFEQYRPILDEFKQRVAERLKLPLEKASAVDKDMNGIYDGITPERNEIRLAPAIAKVTPEQLTSAVQAEINASKARVAAKEVPNAAITGAHDAAQASKPVIATGQATKPKGIE